MASLQRATFATLLVIFALSTYRIKAEQEEDTLFETPLKNEESDPRPQNDRLKRQFYSPWTSLASRYLPILQPQYYQISRPYVIPVWGSAGRLPVYFPPQPLYSNPGYPRDNPPVKFVGPTYLPPATPKPPVINETTTKSTETKYGEGETGPVWDRIPVTSSTTSRPTRLTKKPGQQPVTHPSLVHKEATTAPDTGEKNAVSPIGTLRPSGQSASRPQTTPQPTTELPILTNQPSRCVWAIISCCSASSSFVSYSCFEQLGCTGAFWDKSPCESDFARAAIDAAMNYYSAK